MARLSELGVEFEHWCFACGRHNPAGMQLDFDVTRGRAETRYTGDRRHQGYDGTIHGDGVTTLLDETMGWAVFHEDVWGVTAKIDVAFRRPVPLAEELRVVGEVTCDRGRAIELHGTVTRAADGEVLAEADALFLRMPQERHRELERRYSTAAETFTRVRDAVEPEEEEHGTAQASVVRPGRHERASTSGVERRGCRPARDEREQGRP